MCESARAINPSAPKKPMLAKEGPETQQGSSLFLQVGAFRNRDNAQRLSSKLQNANIGDIHIMGDMDLGMPMGLVYHSAWNPPMLAGAFILGILSAVLVIGFLGYLLDRGMLLLQLVILASCSAVFYVPAAGRRCRVWEMSLPLPGRQGVFALNQTGVIGQITGLMYLSTGLVLYVDRGVWIRSVFFNCAAATNQSLVGGKVHRPHCAAAKDAD